MEGKQIQSVASDLAESFEILGRAIVAVAASIHAASLPPSHEGQRR